ncbi:hypothetical protein HanIR_Chr08g0366971 [Helianthus annuus]|nr:hypothetical protein HanIR_Chr08g0366971 [Helianthus annuus]
METRNKTNAEHRQTTNEALARHETSIEQIHAILQTILGKLQTLEPPQHLRTMEGENDPPRNPKPYLKLHFPRFNGDDPTG